MLKIESWWIWMLESIDNYIGNIISYLIFKCDAKTKNSLELWTNLADERGMVVKWLQQKINEKRNTPKEIKIHD